MTTKQPWLCDPQKEIGLILAPSLLPVVAIFIFQDYFISHEVSSFWWVLLVLCIDVSHVYSTLFRFYWDKPTFVKYKSLLITIPVTAFLIGAGLHNYDSMLFWRILAYVAAFHFVRQQYGFIRLYSRKEAASKLFRTIDTVAIYNATLYPLLYWHLHLTSKLSWFVQGDFVALKSIIASDIVQGIFIAIIVFYMLKEAWVSYQNKLLNIPKNMIMLGTYLSWYVGIITFQGDLIFTLLNVVAHGIPYMGLIWIHGEKKAPGFSFGWKGIAIFMTILLGLAYFEETLWDILVWKDHPDIFPFFTAHDPLDNSFILSVIVPLLVLPQITHYVLDGFIWRFSKDSQARI
jgi:hypothetical protein